MSGEVAAPVRAARRTAPLDPTLDICICTHNPRRDLLRSVIEALAVQSAPTDAFRVLLVDNASDAPLEEALLEPLRRRGVEARLVTETSIGLTQARLRAAHETKAQWICFVDDDNVLAPDYLETALEHIQADPDRGAFGGRLLLPNTIATPRWTRPFLPFLGIKDLGEDSQSAVSPTWCECEPAGAGAVVHRDVVETFCARVGARPDALSLGRKGQGLASCDDSLLMRGSYELGRSVAYDPKLVLEHHIDPRRLRLGYLLRLMYAYGESQVRLERLLQSGAPMGKHYKSPLVAARTLLHNFLQASRKSLAFGFAMLGYHFSAWRAHQRLSSAA
jgi:glycosyltransferase involved in cell wall biosynthesis